MRNHVLDFYTLIITALKILPHTVFKADCLACSVDLIAEIIDSTFLFLVDGSEVEFDFLDGHVLSFRLKVPDLANIDVF